VPELVDHAEAIAREFLAEALPRRWTHVQAVAAKATSAASVLDEDDRAALVAAAWLHDVGYAPSIVSSGLHALDGARWLRDQGYPIRVANLVAYHSAAIFEARERGLEDALLHDFVDEASVVTDALCYCDMTTGPDGQTLDVLDRLDEVRQRYGPDDVVTRFWRHAAEPTVEAVRRFEGLLAAQPM